MSRQILPEGRRPEAIQFFHCFPLLLDPGEVLQIVDCLAVDIAKLLEVVRGRSQQVALEVNRGIALGIGPALLHELLQPGAVKFHGIGERREENIVWAELKVARRLDGSEQVANARNPQQGQT